MDNDVSAEIFAKVGQSDYLVEQLTARAQLEDDEVILAGLRKGDELDNVRVIQLSHYLNLFQNIGSLQI